MEKLNHFVTQKPTSTLYHYTSLEGLMGITESNVLWASNPLYLNDSQELTLAQSIYRRLITERLPLPPDRLEEMKVLNQLDYWLSLGVINNHMIFVSSFSEKDNVLSQWRGYTPEGKGVSIGLDPGKTERLANFQGYRLLKCVYEPQHQNEIATDVLNAIINYSLEKGPDSGKHETESYRSCFEDCTELLLVSSVIMKHISFSEESEWRLVSPISTKTNDSTVNYRAGKSTLIPYANFRLLEEGELNLNLDSIWVGPTPNINLSMTSMSNYLSSKGVRTNRGINNSQLPYRHW
jgi:hypothetical protein